MSRSITRCSICTKRLGGSAERRDPAETKENPLTFLRLPIKGLAVQARCCGDPGTPPFEFTAVNSTYSTAIRKSEHPSRNSPSKYPVIGTYSPFVTPKKLKKLTGVRKPSLNSLRMNVQ